MSGYEDIDYTAWSQKWDKDNAEYRKAYAIAHGFASDSDSSEN